MLEEHQKTGEEKKRTRKNRHLLLINLPALICPPYWITWLELNEVVERQVNNLCRSLDQHRAVDLAWICSRAELNRAEQINCQGLGFFSSTLQYTVLKPKQKVPPARRASRRLRHGRQALPPPLLHLGRRRPLFWAVRWKSLTTSKPLQNVLQPEF